MNIRLPTREEIHAAFAQGEEAVLALFLEVGIQVEAMAEQLVKQAAVIQELPARLEKNSRNSRNPPSSDGYGKPKRTTSLRKPGQKPNGGQPGHEGHALQPSEQPDHQEVHTVETCQSCGSTLHGVEVRGYEERQVFDIPPIRIEVTAHQAEIKICPPCGAENRGVFPTDVMGPVQYGTGVKTWAAYFQNQHFVPVERTAQIFEDRLNHRVAEGTLIKAGQELVEQITPATAAIKEQLRAAAMLHADESGVRVTGKLHWLHVAATDRLTDYEIHPKRGQVAMDDAAILPHFTGRVVHDHWKAYFGYEGCTHALCNAHHLRELKFIKDQYGQSWATTMAELLVEIKETVERTAVHGSGLPADSIAEFERRYDQTLRTGYEANRCLAVDTDWKPPKKKGRPRQSPPLNRLDRLRDFKAEVLAFMDDFDVPFDNNLAERDVRLMKVKQKVSGGFRTLNGAKGFARIRGYIATARKNTVNVFDAIREAFLGKPFLPAGASE